MFLYYRFQWEPIFKGNEKCGLSIQVVTTAGLTVLYKVIKSASYCHLLVQSDINL